MINKAIIVGNLGKDPEKKVSQAGIPVTTFSVATTEKWKDKNTGQNTEQTEWHRVVAFRRLAEICAEYLHKGSKVYIEGRLQTRSWEKDGAKMYTTEIVAQEMKMLDGRPTEFPRDAGEDFGETKTKSSVEDDVPF